MCVKIGIVFPDLNCRSSSFAASVTLLDEMEGQNLQPLLVSFRTQWINADTNHITLSSKAQMRQEQMRASEGTAKQWQIDLLKVLRASS